MSADGQAAEPRWSGRRRAREAALQALYECEVGGVSVLQAMAILDDAGLPEAAQATGADRAFAIQLVSGTWEARPALDARIGEAARHWRVKRLAMLDRLVLRLAVHEMMAYPATPPRVVINEAIDLARVYSGDEAAKFVNGVLDGVFRGLKDDGLVVE